MIHPKGFITLPLLGWVAVGGAVIILGLGVALRVQTSRLDSAKAELAICATQYKQALVSIQKQNEAVERHEKAAENASLRAKAALVKAKASQVASRNERQRLEAEYAHRSKTNCPAGEAVSEIKKGLAK